ncbi:gp4.4 protein [Escherichia phage K1F]|uniref:Gp4.4 protein n=1 Tax=Escherichia phage K1F TaxID=344021 RepID=Q2WC91_BPK1F|nr:gp4.4 protein [Escherichia phage K1F]CAJ29369.1 gp4.4 protein [Escherichia phage K1F]
MKQPACRTFWETSGSTLRHGRKLTGSSCTTSCVQTSRSRLKVIHSEWPL